MTGLFIRLMCLAGALGAGASTLAGPQPGQIVVDPAHPAWFKYEGGGPFYMCGPGDPEGFNYRGTRNADGTRNGDQLALINKMAGTGANCIYLVAIRSHGGDGDSLQNPYVDGDLTKGLDDDILNQWETWFAAMDAQRITIFFILYDDSASPFGKALPANGQLHPSEVTFINTMVNRFKHHKHLIWCVAEEAGEGLSKAHAIKIAEQIKLQDDRQHPVAIHQNNGTSFDFNGNAAFNQFAVQWNVNTAKELHAGTVAAWNNVGGLVNINMAEFAPLSTGLELQRKIWAVAMGGGYSMILEMDIVSTPVSDLETCGRLVRFMEATRFNVAAPHDELAANDTDYVLAAPGLVYLAYGEGGSRYGLQMLRGNYLVKWYDPAGGAWIDAGSRAVPVFGVQVFDKPAAVPGDAALYVSRTVPAPASGPFPVPGAVGVSLNVQLSWTAGAGASEHEVYFGTIPPGEPRGRRSTTLFNPGTLLPRTTYYWRIDEVNEQGITPGAVWSFTTGSVPADYDGDGDVDQEDFGAFQMCLSGMDVAVVPADCLWADLNADGPVDQADAVLFLNCLSGPNVEADCLP
ncbi:MAG TPA: hypothetical protein PLS23_00225 [Phycisphaerae bacterium]|nr:hypothetical protein [Phycisphaerae bacterium]